MNTRFNEPATATGPGPELPELEVPAAERCPECGLPYGVGRFGWGGGVPGAHAERCSTCQRVHDEFPAGSVILRGAWYAAHRKEILRRVLASAERANAEHPSRRVVSVDPAGADVVVRTTDARLARRIGDALCEAYRGTLEYHYDHERNLLQIAWTR